VTEEEARAAAEKRKRNVAKKLREARALASRADLDADQLAKLARIPALEAEAAEIEAILAAA
jgi:hypothetical protein